MTTQTIHTIPLEQTNDSYTPRWVSPEGIRVSGPFRHNRFSTFTVTVFESTDLFATWHGLNREGTSRYGCGPKGGIGDLNARATVIALHRLPSDEFRVIDVAVGDILRTPLGDYEVRDDWSLHDPYLVKKS